jgi:hypothetical protein
MTIAKESGNEAPVLPRKVFRNSLCSVRDVLIPVLFLHFPDRTFTGDRGAPNRK